MKCLAYGFINSKQLSTVQIPSHTGEDGSYNVVGMGKGDFYFGKKLFTGMHGESIDYDMSIDKGHRSLVIATLKADGWTCI